ncbi:hypothetical protein B5X24_HaOG215134 [Helicoverpa armigera]|nr:hypothetical protein B5X24_HaOG215134 [Helicoverpa armigera]
MKKTTNNLYYIYEKYEIEKRNRRFEKDFKKHNWLLQKFNNVDKENNPVNKQLENEKQAYQGNNNQEPNPEYGNRDQNNNTTDEVAEGLSMPNLN